MLFRLLTPLVNIMCHFEFYEVSEEVRIVPALAAMAFHRLTKVDWSLSGGIQMNSLRATSPRAQCVAIICEACAGRTSESR